MRKRAFWVGLLGGIVGTVLISLFAVPFLGIFEMTATGDPGLLDWWGHTNWRSSLVWRAPEEQVPETADPEEGLTHYAATCLQCHGAPAASRAEWAHHMQPMPPKLWEQSTQQLSDGKLFHIIRGGVRMTGMPAFGPKHKDEQIWDMVAFVRQLNDLTHEQQHRLQEAAGGHAHGHGSGEGGHAHAHRSGDDGGHGREHRHSESSGTAAAGRADQDGGRHGGAEHGGGAP